MFPLIFQFCCWLDTWQSLKHWFCSDLGESALIRPLHFQQLHNLPETICKRQYLDWPLLDIWTLQCLLLWSPQACAQESRRVQIQQKFWWMLIAGCSLLSSEPHRSEWNCGVVSSLIIEGWIECFYVFHQEGFQWWFQYDAILESSSCPTRLSENNSVLATII